MSKRRLPTRRPAKSKAGTTPTPPTPAESGDVAREFERTLAAGCRAIREGGAYADNLSLLHLAKEYIFGRAKLDLERQAVELGEGGGAALPPGFDPFGAIKVKSDG